MGFPGWRRATTAPKIANGSNASQTPVPPGPKIRSTPPTSIDNDVATPTTSAARGDANPKGLNTDSDRALWFASTAIPESRLRSVPRTLRPVPRSKHLLAVCSWRGRANLLRMPANVVITKTRTRNQDELALYAKAAPGFMAGHSADFLARFGERK
jgi:hypothetical protein